MHEATVLLVLVVLFALAFDYINGFHDTANAIATVVSTRVLSPRVAIIMAACLNFLGALFSVQVAKTIAKGLVDISHATATAAQTVILAALIGAIVWNLITWRFGIPSSSSHALIGGLIGAAIAHGGLGIVIWAGLKDKVLIPLLISPVMGFIIGFAIMAVIYLVFARVHPGKIGNVFRQLQIVSAAAMAFAHGQADAQKSMGIITMALVSLKVIAKPDVPLWVIISCAIAMALGTSAGGYRIMKTMGHKIIRLEPVQGFAAETAAATVLFTTAHFGMPVSTTHVISGSIFGVGSSKRFSAVRWGVAQSMVTAWVLTIPASASVAYAFYYVFNAAGLK
ncbi:MAG: inorganic phosphate transporter [Chthonomonadales bacterium]